MIVLGIDLETTGLNVEDCEILEVGAVLWDCESGRPVRFLSELVQIKGELPATISELTGIQIDDIEKYGQPIESVMERLFDLAKSAAFIVAHNGIEFDRLFLEKVWGDFPKFRLDLKWIDTSTDIPFPERISTRKLSYLAAEHGFLNPFAHRALFDVMTMLQVLKNYPIEDVIELQASPMCRLVAQVSYENRGDAKSQGFRWDPQQRHWYLQGKEKSLKAREFPFPVVWV